MLDRKNVIDDFAKIIDYLRERYKAEYHGTTREILDATERIKIAENALALLKEQEELGTELTNAMELIHKKNERIKKLEEQVETLTRWRANAGAFD